MDQLKPCPFCGGQAEFIELHVTPNEIQRGYFRCKYMCCEQGLVKDKDEATEDWNRRASDVN